MNDLRLLRISDHKWINLNQVCSIQVRGDVIDFHPAVTRGYEPAIVSASGEGAQDHRHAGESAAARYRGGREP